MAVKPSSGLKPAAAPCLTLAAVPLLPAVTLTLAAPVSHQTCALTDTFPFLVLFCPVEQLVRQMELRQNAQLYEPFSQALHPPCCAHQRLEVYQTCAVVSQAAARLQEPGAVHYYMCCCFLGL